MSMQISKNKTVIAALALAFLLASGGVVMAKGGKIARGNRFHRPAIQMVVGTVSSVSGNAISLAGKNGTTYTVDASSSTIEKIATSTDSAKPTKTAITVADIQTGDTLSVRGKISGTNIAAKLIIDGKLPQRAEKPEGKGNKIIGRPAVKGTVASVSGNTITLTDSKGTTYTIDATNAKITKIATSTDSSKPVISTISVSDIQAGDKLSVRGTVSGTNVTASQITDGVLNFGVRAHGFQKIGRSRR